MDYLEYYNLRNEPFSNAPVSKLYFNSAQHSRALVRLMYAADTMKGLAVLVGELGTGKSDLFMFPFRYKLVNWKVKGKKRR